ncbi:DUF2637 domain-containing protein [Streptomyces sp. NPDC047072]|uniref:DUF2637 domain-containing protein n=1 Tax=Streptomyces sp. NPDC047072 TaxID=3154809 RepID=UPI0033F6F373
MKRREEATGLLPDRRAMDLEAWVRSLCALVVAGVAAYASYVHQREFARQGGADTVSASLWPLSVDGLLLLATVGLLKHSESATRCARWAVRSAFLLGIVVSLAANVAAAPALQWKPVLVAGWPPVALLLSVELLVHRPVERGKDRAAHMEEGQGAGPAITVGGPGDLLLEKARMLDAEDWKEHRRPASAETLRKELHISAARSRQLAALVRNGSRDYEGSAGLREIEGQRRSE